MVNSMACTTNLDVPTLMSRLKGESRSASTTEQPILLLTVDISNHDAIVWNGTVRTVGGTSASSPTFAAVIALVNDALIAAGKPSLGFLNPWLYKGAYKALTDVTSGSSIGCNSTGFPAAVGWDPVTGELGSLNDHLHE
jgi:hypothetical protein